MNKTDKKLLISGIIMITIGAIIFFCFRFQNTPPPRYILLFMTVGGGLVGVSIRSSPKRKMLIVIFSVVFLLSIIIPVIMVANLVH